MSKEMKDAISDLTQCIKQWFPDEDVAGELSPVNPEVLLITLKRTLSLAKKETLERRIYRTFEIPIGNEAAVAADEQWIINKLTKTPDKTNIMMLLYKGEFDEQGRPTKLRLPLEVVSDVNDKLKALDALERQLPFNLEASQRLLDDLSKKLQGIFDSTLTCERLLRSSATKHEISFVLKVKISDQLHDVRFNPTKDAEHLLKAISHRYSCHKSAPTHEDRTPASKRTLPDDKTPSPEGGSGEKKIDIKDMSRKKRALDFVAVNNTQPATPYAVHPSRQLHFSTVTPPSNEQNAGNSLHL